MGSRLIFRRQGPWDPFRRDARGCASAALVVRVQAGTSPQGGGAASTSRSYGIGEVACPLDKKTTRNAWFVTVLQTDTGRRAEYAKARERTLVKELGKLAP